MNYVVGGGQLFFTEQKNKDNFFSNGLLKIFESCGLQLELFACKL